MMNCSECNVNHCFSRRAMYYEEYYKNEWIPAIVGSCIVPDIMEGLEIIINIDGDSNIDYDRSAFPSFELLDLISDVILEEYLEYMFDCFCYDLLAYLMSRRYAKIFENLIRNMRATYKSLDEYFIYMLVFLYGKPTIKNNYLKQDLGFDDYCLLQYIEREKQYWKRIQVQKKAHTRLVTILKMIESELANKKSKFSQKIINSKCSSTKSIVTVEQRNSRTQNEIKKELLKIYGGCVICGITRKNLLEYIHIKPNADCTEEEKLTIANGLIMCIHHHKLFDDGLFYINEYGEIIISKTINEQESKQLQIIKKDKVIIYEDNKPFLKYRENLFEISENKILKIHKF